MASAQGVAQSSLYSGPPGKPRSPKPCDIAIVGMGCLLPGARDVKTFWKNILNRVDAIREIPPERFDYNLYLDSDRKARDRIYSKWGGFLEEIEFDPMRYGIPPAALPSIDPLQLLAIEVVHQALEDAGYLKKNFPKETTAVILGISGGLGDLGLNYGVRSILPTYFGEVPAEIRQDLPEWTEDSFAGLLPNVAAGRVSNRFDLGGVNYTVDAAWGRRTPCRSNSRRMAQSSQPSWGTSKCSSIRPRPRCSWRRRTRSMPWLRSPWDSAPRSRCT